MPQSGLDDQSGVTATVPSSPRRWPVRWRFPEAESTEENFLRRDLRATIDVAWAEITLRLREMDLDGSGETAAVASDAIIGALATLCPDLRWELKRGRAGKRPLIVISSENHRDIDPLVDEILARAPDLERWRITAWRPPTALAEVEAIVNLQSGVALGTEACAVDRLPNGMLRVVLPSFAVPLDDPAEARRIAEFAVRRILGEQVFYRWVSDVLVADIDLESTFPLEDLPRVVEALAEDWLAALPARPLWCVAASARWNRVEFAPTPADDYLGRRDLVTLTELDHPISLAARSAPFLWSRNYSRHCERFVTIKIDRPSLDFDGRADAVAAFDQLLTTSLWQHQAGCIVGSGVGLRYAHHDLALNDVDEAIPLLRHLAFEAGLPLRSWILFFDTSWSREWVGLHPETPPPPGFALPA